MSKERIKKEEIVKIISDSIKDIKSGVFIDYKGAGVADLEVLRGELRKENAGMKIAKKTLIKIGLKEVGVDVENMPQFEGQVALAYGNESEISAPKIISKFIKGKETLKILGGLMEGRFLNAEEVIALSKLPAKEQLIGQLVGTIAAPINNFVYAINDALGRLARVLNAMAKKK